MALKVHKVVVVSCPRCVLSDGIKGPDSSTSREGVGKSCFCNRFVRPDCFSLHHTSILSEDEWHDNSIYNGDHFLYWGAATKRLPDGTRARFQVVEQTEFYDTDYKLLASTAGDKRDYIERATATHFISRGKIAYRLHNEEEYAIPSSLKHNKSAPRATQLFPNHEFSDGKGPTSFICLFDPTLQGEDIKIQVEFLTKLIKEILKNKCKVVLACTKCDEVSKGRIDLGANLAATVAKKPIPFIQTSAKEGINIEETFYHVISAVKTKRNFTSKSSGKNSPSNLIPSYYDVVQSRNLDSTYSTTAFNQLLKERIIDFTTEWSDIWPHLQMHPSCIRAVEMLGIEQVRKMYCQRLMELKVQELRSNHKQVPLSSKVLQNELSAAFRNHPDLGTDSVYDFVYSPSSTPVSRMTRNSTSSDAPPTPVPTPTRTSLPVDTPPPTFVTSPPPPPPTSSIPTPTKTFMFSPTRTSLTLPEAFKMNRSTEVLSTVQESQVDERSFHGSIRFRNRTLPPLPTQEHFSPTRRLSSESFTTSHPQLHDSSTSFTSNSTVDRQHTLHRRLSNSMDCLQANVPSLVEEEEGVDDASPYLCPVEIRKAMELRPDKTASCKLPRQRPRPTIPFDDSAIVQRSQSYRGRSLTMPSHPVHPKRPALPTNTAPVGSSPTHTPAPPTQPKSLNLRKESPLLLGMTIMSPGGGQSSLDFPNDKGTTAGGTAILMESSNEQLDDTSSVASGPFAEIDDTPEDTLSQRSMSLFTKPVDYYQYRSKSHTPDLHSSFSSATLPNRSYTHYNKSAASLLVPLSGQSSTRTSPEKENLYASIPADDEYLTMTAGISFEELLSTNTTKQQRSTSTPTAQSVIKKLKSVTKSKDSSNGDKLLRKNTTDKILSSPRHTTKKVSKTGSHKSFDAAFDRVLDSTAFAQHRPSVPILRPLPPSPTKVMRRKNSSGGRGSPSKRKISGTDRDNIYESIDENEEWFRQLRLERELRDEQKLDLVRSVDPLIASQCNTIMDNFLKLPQIQELWLTTVQSVLPNFQPPKEASIPPFTINPEYIIGYSNNSRHKQDMVEEEGDSSDVKESNQEDEGEGEEEGKGEGEEERDDVGPMVDDFDDQRTHRKLAMTDSVLMRMNRSLQQESSSSSSSSSSEEESEDEEEQYEFDSEREVGRNTLLDEFPTWPQLQSEGTDTLQSNVAPLLLIQQQEYNTDDNQLMITSPNDDINRGDTSYSESEEEEEYDHDITSEEEEGEGEEGEKKETDDNDRSSSVSDSTPRIIHQDGYTLTPSYNNDDRHDDDEDKQTLLINKTAPYIVQNGHLSVCQLNSLDSGISASNGD